MWGRRAFALSRASVTGQLLVIWGCWCLNLAVIPIQIRPQEGWEDASSRCLLRDERPEAVLLVAMCC